MKTRKAECICDLDPNANDTGHQWNCPTRKEKPQHTPTHWIKQVMHEVTRTPEEVASFAGPNAGYVLRAVNSYEELLTLAKIARAEARRKNDDAFVKLADEAIAKAEAK